MDLSFIYDNKEEESNSEIFSKNKIRRKNNSKRSLITSNQIYYCGCKKIFLSYPGIYMHVNNKHNREFPLNSKSIKNINFETFQKKSEDYILNQLEINKKDIKLFITDNKYIYSKNNLFDNLILDLLIEQQDKYDFIKEFIENYKNFIDKYIINKINNKFKIDIKKIIEDKKINNFYFSIIHFLFYIKRISEDNFLKEILIFVLIYIKSMIIYNSSNNNLLIKNLIISSNDFINDTFRKEYIKFNFNFNLFGKEDYQIINLISFNKIFINWFYANKYIIHKLEFNFEFNI